MSETTIASAAPDSTTAALAAQVPKETNGNVDATISSVTPESTTVTMASGVPKESRTPSLKNVPGEFPQTPSVESSDPTAAYEEGQDVSINPLPASQTPGNPVTLEPGEPVPRSDYHAEGVNGGVRLDKESYEKADASNLGVGVSGVPVLPDVVTPAEQREAEGRGVLDIEPPSDNTVLEGSSSIAGGGEVDVPVPAIVKESQEQADTLPEASGIPGLVEQKKAVEEELREEVPVIQPTTEGDTLISQAQAYTAAAAATVTVTVGEIAATVIGLGTTSDEDKDETEPAAIPEVVERSQLEAHASPEASAVESVVEAKKEVESELLEEVAPVAPVEEEPAEKPIEPVVPVQQVPEVVIESMAEDGVEPEASGVTKVVEAKKAVESELVEEVKPSAPIQPSTTEGAATTSTPEEPKTQTETGLAVPQASSPPLSPTAPLSPTTLADPMKNGTSKNGTPRKSIENGERSGTLTKKKRRSIFGVIKDRLRFGKDKGKSKGEMSP
jgi:hypothetical protein